MRRFIPFLKSPPRVNVLRLSGTIGGAGRLTGGGLTDDGLAPLIERAFVRGKPAAVALAVNSPGGSPVQSSLIAARIRRLAEEKGVKVHAFVEDVAASGGYWLAAAADDIWIDDASIVGSIGVIAAGFGFPGLLDRIGVERRVHTAGRSKSFMDPFLPEKPEDIARLTALIEPVHEVFIAHVRARRGARLAAREDLFQGDVWVGAQAVAVGLADGIGHMLPKLRDLYGESVELVPMGQRRSLIQRLGMGLAAEALAAVEERAHFARYGR